MINYFIVPGLNQMQFRAFVRKGTPKDSELVESIINAIEHATKINLYQLRSQSRKREIVAARQMAMHLMDRHTKMTKRAIANIFGGRDHSTCCYSIDTVNDLLETDKGYQKLYMEIEGRIK